jgi:hypothetical protein
MSGELHYAVCMRCGMVLRGPPDALSEHRVARGARGDLVIVARRRPGCGVCGQSRVEVRWGVPPSVTSRLSPSRLDGRLEGGRTGTDLR